MKNTIRARRNGGKIQRSPQVQTPGYPAVKSRYYRDFDLAEGQEEDLCLCIYSRETERPELKVPLTDSEFSSLRAQAVKNGVGIPGFVANAVREKLLTMLLPKVIEVERELDEAQYQSTALHFLLIDSMKGEADGEYNSDIQCGILELVIASERRLKKANALASCLMRDEKTAEVGS